MDIGYLTTRAFVKGKMHGNFPNDINGLRPAGAQGPVGLGPGHEALKDKVFMSSWPRNDQGL